MGDNVFMGPKYNNIIEPETDAQFVTVPLGHMPIGARKSVQPKDLENAQTLKHVGSEK